MAYPTADPNAPAPPAPTPASPTAQPYTPTMLTDEQKAEADVFLAQLIAEADAERAKYIQNRVPAALQPYYLEKYPPETPSLERPPQPPPVEPAPAPEPPPEQP